MHETAFDLRREDIQWDYGRATSTLADTGLQPITSRSRSGRGARPPPDEFAFCPVCGRLATVRLYRESRPRAPRRMRRDVDPRRLRSSSGATFAVTVAPTQLEDAFVRRLVRPHALKVGARIFFVLVIRGSRPGTPAGSTNVAPLTAASSGSFDRRSTGTSGPSRRHVGRWPGSHPPDPSHPPSARPPHE
jgi:hypothetical protein